MFSKNPRWSKRYGRSETIADTNNVNNDNLSSSRSKPNQSITASTNSSSSKKSPPIARTSSGKFNPTPRPKKESLAEFLKKSREARTRFEKASKEASDFRQSMRMNFQKLRCEREKIRKVRLESWIKQQISLVKIRDRLVDIIDRLEDQEKEKEKPRSKLDDNDFDASFFRTNGTSSKRRQNNKYVAEEYSIITGGKFGLGYRNLVQSTEKGKTFSIDIDVSGYLEKEISIETEDNRMIIKGLKENGESKSMTIIAPTTMDIEGMIIKPPANGTLSLEAP